MSDREVMGAMSATLRKQEAEIADLRATLAEREVETERLKDNHGRALVDLGALLATARKEALEEMLEKVDFVRCGSGPTDEGNDVWREACDSMEALVRSALASDDTGRGHE